MGKQLGFGFGKGRRVIKTIVAGATPRPLTGLKALALMKRDLEKRRMAKADLRPEAR